MDKGHAGTTLLDAARMSSWSTPSSRDWKDTPGMATEAEDGRKRLDQLPRQTHLSGWPTPAAQEAGGTPEAFLERKRQAKEKGKKLGVSLTSLSLMAQEVGPVRITADGQTLTGSSARMESGGQLNPAHSRWLMGYPNEWEDCAPMATQSSRK